MVLLLFCVFVCVCVRECIRFLRFKVNETEKIKSTETETNFQPHNDWIDIFSGLVQMLKTDNRNRACNQT